DDHVWTLLEVAAVAADRVRVGVECHEAAAPVAEEVAGKPDEALVLEDPRDEAGSLADERLDDVGDEPPLSRCQDSVQWDPYGISENVAVRRAVDDQETILDPAVDRQVCELVDRQYSR